MRKSDLIEKLARRFGDISIQHIKLHVNTIIDMLRQAMGKQQRIEIRDFGSFACHYRAAYRAYSPVKSGHVTVPATNKPHFKPGKKLKENVNKS